MSACISFYNYIHCGNDRFRGESKDHIKDKTCPITVDGTYDESRGVLSTALRGFSRQLSRLCSRLYRDRKSFIAGRIFAS